jgi:hypothetical protein
VCSSEGEGVPLQERLAGQTGDQTEQIQVMAQPSSLLEKPKIKSQNCHTNFGEKSPDSLVM